MQINVKNAVWCLNMKDFSLFGSEKEGLKNIESKKQSGIVLVSLYTVKWLVKNFVPSVSYSEAIRASRDFTNK